MKIDEGIILIDAVDENLLYPWEQIAEQARSILKEIPLTQPFKRILVAYHPPAIVRFYSATESEELV